MAETTITGLPNATVPLSGTERVPMDQGGVTRDASAQDIANLAGGAITSAVNAHVGEADPHPGYLLETDPAVTDARTPTAHKGTHATGGSDALSPADIGAEVAGAASSAVSTHVGQADPHTQYALESDLGTAAALNVGTSAGDVVQIDSGGRLPAVDGSQLTNLPSTGGAVSSVSATAPISSTGGTTPTISISEATTNAAGSMSSADKTKLNGIATGATVNATDAALRDRATHTGTQGAETITGLGTAAAQNVGTAAGNVVQLDGSARLPAVDGSQLTNLPGGGDDVTLGASLTDVLGITEQVLSGVDAGADRILFWDDSADRTSYLQVSTGLAITETTLAIDSTVVTLTGAQTLSGKTLGNLRESGFTIVDGASVDINPADGPLQTWTLGANRTPTATNFLDGQSVKIKIDDGTDYSVDWANMGVVWLGSTAGSNGTAPILGTTGYTHVLFTKEGATLYGAFMGYTAT